MKFTNVHLSFINEDLFTFKNVHENFHFQSQSAQNDILIKNDHKIGHFRSKLDVLFHVLISSFWLQTKISWFSARKFRGLFFEHLELNFRPSIFFFIFDRPKKFTKFQNSTSNKVTIVLGIILLASNYISNYCTWSDWTRFAVLQLLEIGCNCLQSVAVACKWLQLVVIAWNWL